MSRFTTTVLCSTLAICGCEPGRVTSSSGAGAADTTGTGGSAGAGAGGEGAGGAATTTSSDGSSSTSSDTTSTGTGSGGGGFAPIGCSASGWCWSNPWPQGNLLSGVSGTSPSDVWAVGVHGTILHFDGTEWTRALVDTTERLYDVWAAAPDDAWAVGKEGLALHWDGASWTPVATGGNWELTAVWGSGPADVWAAANTKYAELQAFLHWDGAAWSSTPWVHFAGVDAMWGSAANDIYAIGSHIPVMHHDGASWSFLDHIAGFTADVWGTGPDDVWVVGEGQHNGYAAHYDGASWASTTIPGLPLTTVWGSETGDVWAAGRTAAGLLEVRRRDGADWSFAFAADTLPAVAAWGTGGDHWAVGDGGTLVRVQDGAFSAVSKNVAPVYSIAGISGVADDLWVVGYEYSAHWDGSAWTQVPTPAAPDRKLMGVWWSSPQETFAVDNDGAVLRWDGASWSIETTVADDARAIWGRSADDVWVAGSYSHVTRWDGIS